MIPVKIRNETPYRTDHLRAFVTRVAADELDTAQRRTLHVIFSSKVRRGWRRAAGATSGWAVIGGSRMTVFLTGAVDRRRLAHTLAHEMAHIRGMRHPEMRGSPRYTWASGWEALYAYADALPMDRAARPAKPSAWDRAAARLAHAQQMLARWERRAKAAQGRARRWREQARRRTAAASRRLAAQPAAPQKEGVPPCLASSEASSSALCSGRRSSSPSLR